MSHILLLSLLALTACEDEPVDSDSDGVVGAADKCPSVKDDGTGDGCAYADADRDGIYEDLAGYRALPPSVVADECPTRMGTGGQGCPAPTAEELALTAWGQFEKECRENDYSCAGAQEKLALLAAAEQNEERTKFASAAEQKFSVYQAEILAANAKPYEIPAIEEALGKITDEKVRAEIRFTAARLLWRVPYDRFQCDFATDKCYADTDPDSGQQMTREEAYDKADAFQKYPPAEEFVADLTENGNRPGAVIFAHEEKLTEDQTRVAMGLDGDNFTRADDCQGEGRFYAQAARYGWFEAEAERCVREYRQDWLFKSAITFAGRADMSETVESLTREAHRVALENIEHYAGNLTTTGDGEIVIEIGDWDDWKGS